MPQLKQLSCTIQWANTGAPFPEYATVYGDGLVESFIVVPNKPQAFTIHLKSLSYIYEGLAMVVFVDGNYQSNRNRVNLKPAKKDSASSRTQIDFLVRQREKPLGEGVYMGRQWRFDNHNIVDQLPDGVKESHFDLLGTIEVLVLRCRARIPEEIDESGSSSAADSDALCENGERFLIDDDVRSIKPNNKDGSAEEEIFDTIGILPFGGDATNDHIPYHSTFNAAGSRMPDHAGWYPVDASRSMHGRNRSRHHTAPTAHMEHNPTHHPSTHPRNVSASHIPMTQKHVRFDVDPLVHPHRPHIPHRPRSHERRRPSTFMPSRQDYIPTDHAYLYPYDNVPAYVPPPGDPLRYHDYPVPQYYQQQSFPVPPPPYAVQQPGVIVPPYGPVHQHQFPVLHQPPVWPAVAYPYHHLPRPYQQPPHMMFNPRHQGQRPLWPNQSNFANGNPQNPSPATVADSSKNSAGSGGNQQQNGMNQQGQDWDAWNQQGTQNNGNSDWSNNNQNNGSAGNWGDNQNNNTDQDWENSNQQNNNTTTNWDEWNNNTNNNADNDAWVNGGGNDNNGNDHNWNTGGTGDQQNNNFGDGPNEQDSTEDTRALFGPHGQYYTYHPRGSNEPGADAEEEPRYDVPRKIATATGSTKQVLPGSGYMYWKKRRAPEYIDTMEEPYARFVFKYRTKDQLEKETGVKVEVEPTGDEAVQELQGMDKEALIEMLIRAKGALGGKVPIPRAKPTSSLNDKDVPVPVEPPDHSFLRYSLPELRRSMPSITDNGTNVNGNNNQSNGGWNAGSTGGQGAAEWNANNNDNTWANQDNWNTGGVSGGNNNNQWDSNAQSKADNINWNKPTSWDGAGGDFDVSSGVRQGQSTLSNNGQPYQPLANANNGGEDWNQGNGPASSSSSPSTLPLNQSFNANAYQVPPVPPAPSGLGTPAGSAYGGGQNVGNTFTGQADPGQVPKGIW